MKYKVRVHYPPTSVVLAPLNEDQFELFKQAMYNRVTSFSAIEENMGDLVFLNFSNFSYITVRTYDDED